MKYGLVVLIAISCGLPLGAPGLPRVARGNEAAVASAAPSLKLSPVVVKASRVGETPPLRQLAEKAAPKRYFGAVREVPLGRLPRPEPREAFHALAVDPVVQRYHSSSRMADPLTTFEGVGNLDNGLPPDNNGDVGPSHYVEMVNFHFCVYDKTTGTNLIAPTLMSQLYAAAGFTGPITNYDNGDPVVLYDHLADRWLISQFLLDGVTPDHEEVAISKTGDPTGAWWLYDFVMPNNKMNDYPKFGVWPDGYYMTDNQFSNDYFVGAGVFVFERAKMLVGDTNASYQYFDLDSVDWRFRGMLPSDLDGPAPSSNTPNYFAMADESVNNYDALYIWEFHVDWTNPGNTTFGVNSRPNHTNTVAPFDPSFSGGDYAIPQPGTSAKLDVLSDRLMFRLQYRYFGSYETLVGCHTVDADTNHAGVRYYQLRRNLPGGTFAIADQATYAPDANHRWMGSAAMDSQGNLAIGFSCSSTGLYPSIRYAGRLAFDPTGSLSQGEATLYAGSGSQTYGTGRWGDYTALTVDPSDDLTFWYVNEYYPATASYDWHTRIGSFRFGTNFGYIVISPGTLSYTATYAGANPAAQTFIVTNAGGAAFSFSNAIRYSAGASGWLALSSPTGYVAGRGSLTITASVVSASLNGGTYTATNTISSPTATNSPQTLVVTLTVASSAAPAAPTGVSASDGTFTDKVQVTWGVVSDVTGYALWRSGMSDAGSATLLAGGIATTNYDDTSAAADTTYYYWVKASNTIGSSAFSSSDTGWRSAAPEEVAPGPSIKANGFSSSIIVDFPNLVTITVAFDVGSYPTDVWVDWWVIASANYSSWYYLHSTLGWLGAPFSGDYTVFHPVHQGQLFDLPSTTVLPAMTLPVGMYYFWFVVDYPADGILDPDGSLLFDQVTVTVQ